MKRRVVVTGIGAGSPNGVGRDAFWEATRNGVSGVRRISRFDPAGYAVRVAANGREALELLRREPADLVLTDVEMPLLDGLGLTETIRKSRTLAKTPVVILTSHDSEADRERGLAAGANAYIVKSGFDQQRLLSMVEQLLLAGSSS